MAAWLAEYPNARVATTVLKAGGAVAITPEERERLWHLTGVALSLQGERAARRESRWKTFNSNVGRLLLGLGGALLAVGLATFSLHRPTPSTQEYRTVSGQHRVVRLRDGSVMRLAPSTVVAVTPDELVVNGEASFVVVPGPGRAFAVRTKNAIARVLGTTFSVRQYPDERTSRVMVAEGKVVVQSVTRGHRDSQRAVLDAHTMAQISDSSVVVTRGIVPSDYTEFARGALVFDGKPLRDVVEELSRVYGVPIRVTDTTLAAQPVLMEVSVTEQSVGQVLELIGKVTQSHYHLSGRTYVITPGRAANDADRARPRSHVISQPEKSYGK